jgi:hypothetical protein
MGQESRNELSGKPGAVHIVSRLLLGSRRWVRWWLALQLCSSTFRYPSSQTPSCYRGTGEVNGTAGTRRPTSFAPARNKSQERLGGESLGGDRTRLPVRLVERRAGVQARSNPNPQIRGPARPRSERNETFYEAELVVLRRWEQFHREALGFTQAPKWRGPDWSSHHRGS